MLVRHPLHKDLYAPFNIALPWKYGTQSLRGFWSASLPVKYKGLFSLAPLHVSCLENWFWGFQIALAGGKNLITDRNKRRAETWWKFEICDWLPVCAGAETSDCVEGIGTLFNEAKTLLSKWIACVLHLLQVHPISGISYGFDKSFFTLIHHRKGSSFIRISPHTPLGVKQFVIPTSICILQMIQTTATRVLMASREIIIVIQPC